MKATLDSRLAYVRRLLDGNSDDGEFRKWLKKLDFQRVHFEYALSLSADDLSPDQFRAREDCRAKYEELGSELINSSGLTIRF